MSAIPIHFDKKRTRTALLDALNGEAEEVHPATRRGLIALATELDEHRISDLEVHQELISALNDSVAALRKQLRAAQALFGTASVGALLALLAAVVGS